MQPRRTLATITEKSLHGLDEVLERHSRTSCSSTVIPRPPLPVRLRRSITKVPVGHVEAGLRTYDKVQPVPEEMNRKLTGQIATLHFAPTPRNRDNLAREGITDGVFVMGNTVVDAIPHDRKAGFRVPR